LFSAFNSTTALGYLNAELKQEESIHHAVSRSARPPGVQVVADKHARAIVRDTPPGGLPTFADDRCDADPAVMGDYIIALLKHDAAMSEEQWKEVGLAIRWGLQ